MPLKKLSCLKTLAQRADLYPVVFKEGSGSYITDSSDCSYLDFLSAATCLTFGHNPDHLIDVYTKQLKKLTHVCFPYTPHKPGKHLIKDIAKYSSIKKPLSVLFGLSGSDSVEGAIKAAFYFTKKSHILVFKGSYHGKGFLSQKLSTFKKDKIDEIALPVTFPKDECSFFLAMKETESFLKSYDVAAFLMEPIQGDAGNRSPYAPALSSISKLAKKYGALIITDEIQSGCGRTGSLWASDLYEIEPDMQIIGKGLTAGLAPMSLCIGREDVISFLPQAEHLFSFMAHPASCDVALEVLKKVSEPAFLEDVKTKSQYVKRLIKNISRKYSFSDLNIHLDGMGLMLGLKLEQKGKSISKKVAYQCFKNRLLVGIFGENADVIRIHPPLNVSVKEIKTAMNILELSIKQVLYEHEQCLFYNEEFFFGLK